MAQLTEKHRGGSTKSRTVQLNLIKSYNIT